MHGEGRGGTARGTGVKWQSGTLWDILGHSRNRLQIASNRALFAPKCIEFGAVSAWCDLGRAQKRLAEGSADPRNCVAPLSVAARCAQMITGAQHPSFLGWKRGKDFGFEVLRAARL